MKKYDYDLRHNYVRATTGFFHSLVMHIFI